MESISSENLPIILHTLDKIEVAINRLQERTTVIKSVDDFLLSPDGMEKVVYSVIAKEIEPLKAAIETFKKQLFEDK